MKQAIARQIWACLPSSLFGRHLLLIASLIVAAELGLVFVLRQEVQQARISVAQDYAIRQAHATRAWLSGVDSRSRQAWQAQHPKPAASDTVQLPDSLQYRHAQEYMQALQRQLGENFRLEWQVDATSQPHLWLVMQFQEERYWLELDTSPLHTKLPTLILALALAVGALALGGAALISRLLNRPLQQLAQAALSLGRDHTSQQLQTWHQNSLPLPREIEQVAEALQKMAQELAAAERERALMLAGVSHDLRTPLTKLRLAVEILQQGEVVLEDRQLLQGMVKHIHAADSIIAQFIAYARLGSDEEVQSSNLNALLHEIATDFQVSAGMPPLSSEHRELLQLCLPSYTLHLACRPSALRRAIVNLLENALRYATPQHAHEIVLALHEDGTQCTISVADRGPGIAAEQREHVRHAFTRLAHARNSSPHGQIEGLGLGLAIVERIAILHGGSLQLQEREGGGLLACIILPLNTGHLEKP